MHNIRRFYYQNKEKIWKLVFFIVFIILLIQIINYAIKTKNEKNISIVNNNNLNNSTNNINESYKNTQIMSNQSIITGGEISNAQLNKDHEIIENFVNYCNNKEYENAYNLLSKKCKEIYYPSLQDFYNLYIREKFDYNTSKIAEIENWVDKTYKVDMYENPIKVGNVNSEKIQDYITIVMEDNENKININGFIDYNEINYKNLDKDVLVNVINKTSFMDYEEYKIEVTNNTTNTILLDNLESSKTIYIKDKNSVEYYAIINEIIKSKLEIKSGFSSEINIKFYKKYNPNRKTEQLVFSNVLLDFNTEQLKQKEIIIDF